jgi:DNA polymerase III alpha subunit (gram-positive type)
MKNLVLDIETKKSIDDVGGWINKHKMGIAVLCAIDLDSGEEFIFSDSYPGAESLDGLFEFLDGNVLIGHNICSFDFRLIQEEVAKNTNDELVVGLLDTGAKRISLASFSEAMFGTFKKMHGADAPIEWQKGNKKKVVEYCMDDVRKTVQLLKHGIDNGFVYYLDKDKEKKKIDVDWGKKLKEINTKVQYPDCFGGFRINKKIWQCSRCHTKGECKEVTSAG